MPHPTDQFITCRSCDFRFPQSRGMCVMCGAPVSATTEVQAAPEAVSEPSGSGQASKRPIFHEPPAAETESQGSGKSIGIGIAVAVVLLVPLFLVIANWHPSKSMEPAAAVTTSQLQGPSGAVAAPVRAAKKSARGVRAPAPVKQPAEMGSTIPASENDPAELWKGVRSGNTHAEVTLAKLYLDGNTVPQSCEQTHMLLLAASKKGYKAADDLLAGGYAERCAKFNSTTDSTRWKGGLVD